jgi:hypothetical protein
MKCRNMVLFEKRKKKGSGREYDYPKRVISWFHKQLGQQIPETEMVVCGGKIVVSVKLDEEPYLGGCSYSTSIEYRCDRCKGGFYPELPSFTEGFSKLATELIEGISDVNHSVMQAMAIEQERIRRLPYKEQVAAFKQERRKG